MTISRLLISLFCLLIGLNAYASGGGTKVSNYLSISPAFVVNVNDGLTVRHMQVKVQLKLSSPDFGKYVEQHKAAIQHEMVMLLSGRPVAELKTIQGKETLRNEALAVIQKVMQENTRQKIVEAVYFTELIIQ